MCDQSLAQVRRLGRRFDYTGGKRNEPAQISADDSSGVFSAPGVIRTLGLLVRRVKKSLF